MVIEWDEDVCFRLSYKFCGGWIGTLQVKLCGLERHGITSESMCRQWGKLISVTAHFAPRMRHSLVKVAQPRWTAALSPYLLESYVTLSHLCGIQYRLP